MSFSFLGCQDTKYLIENPNKREYLIYLIFVKSLLLFAITYYHFILIFKHNLIIPIIQGI